jgi:hypothetical protein
MASNLSSTSSSGNAAEPSATSPRLDNAVRGVHDTVDRVAAKVTPAIDHLVGSAHSAADAAHERARRLNETSSEWAESLRATVREHPLTSLAMALAAGYLACRIAAPDRYADRYSDRY